MVKWLKICAVIIGIGVLLIPLITKNHIYQHVALGGDTKVFIQIMNNATDGYSLIQVLPMSLYLGEAVTLWTLGVVNRLLHMNPEVLFYIYSVLVLIAVGITLYYVGRFINRRTGWLVLILGMLCTNSILGLYTYACMVNIINVYIVFMWAVILIGYWYVKKKIAYLISGVVLLALFCVLHPTALYLPSMLVVLFIMLGILSCKKKIEWSDFGQYGGIILVFLALSLVLLIVTRENQVATLAQSILPSIQPGQGNRYLDYLFIFFMQDLTIISTIILCLIVFSVFKYRHLLRISRKLGYMLVVLGSLTIVLIVGSILGVTDFPERVMLDATTMLTILGALLLGNLLRRKKLDWFRGITYVLMGIGAIFTIANWVV